MEKGYYFVQAAIAGVIAWVSAQLGILFPVLILLAVMMCMDYLTGMAASRAEALEYPDDPAYGWTSKKGAKGILKKVGYICVIAVAMVVDFIILHIAGALGIDVSLKAFFGLLVAVWYLLNELLSIIENAGRMGAPVPEWLTKYVAVLKNKIDDKAEGE